MRVSTRRMGWVLVGLLALFGRSAAAGDEVGAEEMQRASVVLTRADQALRTGNLTKAESLYRKALEIVADHPEGHLGLGHIFMRREQFQAAHDAFDRSRVSYSTMSGAVFQMRVDRYRNAQEQLSRARQRHTELTQAIQRIESIGEQPQVSEPPSGEGGNGSRPPVGSTRARVQGSSGAFRSQLRSVEQQIQRLEAIDPPVLHEGDPVPGEVHFFLGNALLNLERLDEAIEHWEACAAKSPDFPWVHNNLAVGYWKRLDIEPAVASLIRAEELGFPVNPSFKADLQESWDLYRAAVEAAAGSATP